MMDFKSCVNEKIIIKEETDSDRVKSLMNLTGTREEFWSKKYASKYDFLAVEGYYEIVKELLTALINLHGLKCANHECLISFFREKYPQYDYESEMIDTMRRVRNAIDYRGVFADEGYLSKNRLEFSHIIELLQKLVKEKIV